MITVLRNEQPVARKAHRCELCGTHIPVGQRYNRETNIWDGQFYTWVMCLPCVEIFSFVWEWSAGYYRDDGIDSNSADDWARDFPDDPRAKAYLARRADSSRRGGTP